jgi:predicted ATPase
MTKAVVEAGADRGHVSISAVPPSSLAVPATLHASLLARLDRLGPIAKEIAQTGAAIGREFSYELLTAAWQRSEAKLRDGLAHLVDAGLVFQRGTPPEASFLFKHALVQDTAYSMLLRSPRQALHARIAQALETRSPELMDNEPEVFARHYAAAGLVEKSADYWGKAGHRYAARSAMEEAAAQFQMALDELALLPDNRQRQRKELEFCSALGAALRFVRGQAAPEIGRAFTRARELWEQLGFPTEYIHIPYGQSRYHVYRGETDVALRLDEDLLRVSRQRNDSRGLVLSHQSCGTGYLMRGRFALSRSFLETVLSLYNPTIHDALGPQTGSHPHVVAEGYLGVVLLCLGFPDQALTRTNAAIAEARRLAYPPSLGSSLMISAIMLSLAGDNRALEERADELVAVATEQGVPWWRTVGTIYRGWVKAKNADVAEGISLLRCGFAAYRASGAELLMHHHTALLARAFDIASQVDEAVAAFDDALGIAGRTAERWLDAELYRHKGLLLLRQGHLEAAEELYWKALSIARKQGAKLWELRAAVSLARLYGEEGRRAEARDLLAPIYGWFTEGFDKPDLREAKALLDELT